DLDEEPRLVLLLDAGHPRERVAVVPHRLFLGLSLHLARVLQDELAVLGVAALLVAGQGLGHADVWPDFLREVVVDGAAARRPFVGFPVLAASSRGTGDQSAEDDNN